MEWDAYVDSLKGSDIIPFDDTDLLVWSGDKKTCSVKNFLVYESILSQLHLYQQEWYSVIWKVKIPQKVKCFMFLFIKHKILTWDMLQWRGF